MNKNEKEEVNLKSNCMQKNILYYKYKYKSKKIRKSVYAICYIIFLKNLCKSN